MNYVATVVAVGVFVMTLHCNRPAPLTIPQEGTCESACTNLRKLGCPEGQPSKRGTSCEGICERMLKTKLSDPHVTCVTAATDYESVRACGSVECE